MISSLGARLRGLLGLGVLGGLLGFVGGLLWTLGVSLFGLGGFAGGWVAVASQLTGAATLWGLLGAFTATAFGTLLMFSDSKRSLDQLPLWRMAVLGALAGAAFLPAFVTIRFGVAFFMDAAHTLLPTMGLLATFGAAFTTSLVVMAQRAHRAELDVVEDAQALLEGDATGG